VHGHALRCPALATVPQRLGKQRATVPPIVLPITSRGVRVTDRLCWGGLGVAMLAAAAVILYLNRGTTFFLDELTWVYQSPALGARDVIEPHNGHLIATTRLVYKGLLEAVGTDYVVFRVLAVSTVLLSAGLFYTLVKRRIGALPALAPAVVLLFFGAAWQHVLFPIGFTIVFSVAAGLGALLALERGDRRGDAIGCALLVLSVATYTTGLPFVVGVAVSVLLRPDRRRRAWIFLVPLALYAAWWLWSLGQPDSAESETTISNVLLIPNYAADSLAAVTGALVGLEYDFSNPPPSIAPEWGRVVAVVAVAGLVLRVRRGNVPHMLWIALGIVLTYWSLDALATFPGDLRLPWSTRYMYLGAVGVLLAGSAAAAGLRFSRAGLFALFAVAAVSVTTGLALMRDAGNQFRSQRSAETKAQFAMLDLARPHIDPNFDPPEQTLVAAPASAYYAAADRYGSPAFTLAEVEDQSETVRALADQGLADELALMLQRSPSGSGVDCRRVTADAGAGAVGFELPAGGATLRAPRGGRAEVTVGRFATAPTAPVGSLQDGRVAALRIPTDASTKPWRAAVSGVRSVQLCALR